jgi:hypothetical protein
MSLPAPVADFGLERFNLEWKRSRLWFEQLHQPDSLRDSSQADIALERFPL